MKTLLFVIGLLIGSLPTFAGGSISLENEVIGGNQRLQPSAGSLTQEEIKRLVSDSTAIRTGKRIVVSSVGESQSQERFYYPKKSAVEIEFKWMTDSVVISELGTIENSTWIKNLPATLIPNTPSLENYREAAARMRANIILLYKVDANIYENFKLFGKNTAMAISTIDFVVLNVAEGAVTNSEVVSKRVKIQQNENETADEMVFRAKNLAILESLKEGIAKIKMAL